MKKLFVIFLSLFTAMQGFSCTTAVISGKHTKDGRPIIWKLRDSDYLKNKLMYFSDANYNFIGLVNSEDSLGNEVWGGANDQGFSIMNSASFNVNIDDSASKKDLEGYFMKQALQSCATLIDFEELLKTTPKPMGLAAHFGVIDALGGCAFYEVNNYTFTKFDANNEDEAPNGYIIRTNYSFTGMKDVGYGYIRYQTAKEIFAEAATKDPINCQTIIQDFSRCFKHSVLKKDFRKEYEQIPEGDDFINSGDLITRNGSASNIVINGVKPGEPVDLVTIWSMIAYPNTCLALPVWVRGGENLPKMLVENETGNAPLNDMALKLKEQCYPISRSSGYKYMQISKLINAEETGIVQKLETAENKVFISTQQHVSKWLANKPMKDEIQEYYIWLDEFTKDTYLREFAIEAKK
ncbi:MAG: hypothetical protein JEZ09_08625 [Salinivirgaceae bacterium]|nr:hypothetical protein [Salinivirgaceae bacterium]